PDGNREAIVHIGRGNKERPGTGTILGNGVVKSHALIDLRGEAEGGNCRRNNHGHKKRFVRSADSLVVEDPSEREDSTGHSKYLCRHGLIIITLGLKEIC